jgi:hypothetical protein
MQSIFRMPGGDVRWGWKAAILVVGTLLFGIVLNAVLPIVLIAFYSSQGLADVLAVDDRAGECARHVQTVGQRSTGAILDTERAIQRNVRMPYLAWLIDVF